MNSIPFLASLATAAPGYEPSTSVAHTQHGDPPPHWRFLLGLLAVACAILVLASRV